MAKEVLCVTTSGLLQLGIETPFGIQTSIENFTSFDEAKSWARRNSISLRYYAAGRMIREEDFQFLAAIRLSASIDDAVTASGRSPSGIVSTLLRLSTLGYLHLSRSKRRKDWTISLTDLAQSTLTSLAGVEANA
ncbi:hypothetical protein NKW43_05850 [Gluconobacter albidus]|uniref:hypothetical protein n=1 Tax=Gluconobacter albidus TaxID=318683 RepID=UPI0020A0610A|nr:hypothetical protein [Gluconobacter albidus]MCP1273207.1 hypothetical protein [Gluconobacter albidus]